MQSRFVIQILTYIKIQFRHNPLLYLNLYLFKYNIATFLTTINKFQIYTFQKL
jgi:hypothetical protein